MVPKGEITSRSQRGIRKLADTDFAAGEICCVAGCLYGLAARAGEVRASYRPFWESQVFADGALEDSTCFQPRRSRSPARGKVGPTTCPVSRFLGSTPALNASRAPWDLLPQRGDSVESARCERKNVFFWGGGEGFEHWTRLLVGHRL